jgi:hypothetical protein
MVAHESAWTVDRKEFLQQSLRLNEASFGKTTDLACPPWIGNKSLFVQTVHGLPIEAFSSPIDVMEPRYNRATMARSILSNTDDGAHMPQSTQPYALRAA